MMNLQKIKISCKKWAIRLLFASLAASNLSIPQAFADSQGPTGTIVINGGDPTTDNPVVTLTLSAVDDTGIVDEMQIANGDYAFTWYPAFESPKTWTLSSGDGLKTVQIMYRDNSGNWSVIFEDTIYLNTTPPDTEAPVGSFTINNGEAETTTEQVTLTISATDNSGTVDEMQFSNDGVNYTVMPYDVSADWTLTPGSGVKTVHAMFRDVANNWSSAVTSTITLNNTPPDDESPTGSISINSGIGSTLSRNVLLSLTAQDNSGEVVNMQIANEDFNFAPVEPYAPLKEWTLNPPLHQPLDYKHVYVMYQDAAGNWSEAYGARIQLYNTHPDEESPTGTITINNGNLATDSDNVTLQLSATDNSGSVDKMQFANENQVFSTPENYATTRSWTMSPGIGTKTVYVRYRDFDGNWSQPIQDVIQRVIDLSDIEAPTGTISIDGGASTTDTTQVNLELSANDNSGTIQYMQIANEDFVFDPVEPFSPTKSWTLSPWQGQKYVYVMYQDAVGNWSLAYESSIELTTGPIDSQAPTGSITINNGDADTENLQVTLTLNATDDLGGVSLMQFANEDYVYSDPEPYAATKVWPLSNWGGIKQVNVMYQDSAGNWSEAYTDTINLTGLPEDDEPPVGTVLINDGDYGTTNTQVTLTVAATDNTGFISEMQFSNDGVNYSTPEPFSLYKEWTINNVDGFQFVYVMFRDINNNWSYAYSDAIVLNPQPADLQPPVGTVLINNGDSDTYSQHVVLTLNATDNSGHVDEMQFSNNGIDYSDPEPYKPTKEWSLSPLPSSGGSQMRGVSVMFRDKANNWSTSTFDNIQLRASTSDTESPEGTVIINNHDPITTTQQVTLSFHATDDSGVITSMQIANEDLIFDDPEPYVTYKTWDLSAGDGPKTVYVRYQDASSNWSELAMDEIELNANPDDTQAPTGSITINNGDATTTSTTVNLTIAATDDSGLVQWMRFANEDGVFDPLEGYDDNKTWTLSPGVGEKTVLVQFQDAAGNWSETYTDTIVVPDTEIPTGTIQINEGAATTTTTNVMLQISATDNGGNILQMQISNNGMDYTQMPYEENKMWQLDSGDGTKTVHIMFEDLANNWSEAATDTIVLDTSTPDTIAPTGSVQINGGAVTTNNANVQLSLSATDNSGVIAQMQISNDGTNYDQFPYEENFDWQLPSGDGQKTVHVMFEDPSNNWSEAATASILLQTGSPDTEAPMGSFVINEGAATTDSLSVVLGISATDNSGTVSQMQISNDGVTYTLLPYEESYTWPLEGSGSDTKIVYMRFGDLSGNWSDPVSSQIEYVEHVGLYNATITYTYDDLNRLRGVDRPEGTINYTYDEKGNMTLKSVVGY